MRPPRNSNAIGFCPLLFRYGTDRSDGAGIRCCHRAADRTCSSAPMPRRATSALVDELIRRSERGGSRCWCRSPRSPGARPITTRPSRPRPDIRGVAGDPDRARARRGFGGADHYRTRRARRAAMDDPHWVRTRQARSRMLGPAMLATERLAMSARPRRSCRQRTVLERLGQGLVVGLPERTTRPLELSAYARMLGASAASVCSCCPADSPAALIAVSRSSPYTS